MDSNACVRPEYRRAARRFLGLKSATSTSAPSTAARCVLGLKKVYKL